MSDCVFCGIVAGTEPATIVREWPDAVAFVPLGPVIPDSGHVLVVPRRHVADAVEDLAVTAATMARAAEFAAGHGASNIITSIGRAATQSIFHLHIHVIRRTVGDQLMVPWGTTGNPRDPHSCKRSEKAEADNARLRALAAGGISRLGQELEAGDEPRDGETAPGHEPGCWGAHHADDPCAEIIRYRAEHSATGAVWFCPTSPSRGQRAHWFGDEESEWGSCLNGCGTTWQGIREATT